MSKETQPKGEEKESYRSQFESMVRFIGGFEEPALRSFKKGRVTLYVGNGKNFEDLKNRKVLLVGFESNDVSEAVILNSRDIVNYTYFIEKSRTGISNIPYQTYILENLRHLQTADALEMRQMKKELRENLFRKVQEFIVGAQELPPNTS